MKAVMVDYCEACITETEKSSNTPTGETSLEMSNLEITKRQNIYK
jgi:hypothetical protein